MFDLLLNENVSSLFAIFNGEITSLSVVESTGGLKPFKNDYFSLETIVPPELRILFPDVIDVFSVPFS